MRGLRARATEASAREVSVWGGCRGLVPQCGLLAFGRVDSSGRYGLIGCGETRQPAKFGWSDCQDASDCTDCCHVGWAEKAAGASEFDCGHVGSACHVTSLLGSDGGGDSDLLDLGDPSRRFVVSPPPRVISIFWEGGGRKAGCVRGGGAAGARRCRAGKGRALLRRNICKPSPQHAFILSPLLYLPLD